MAKEVVVTREGYNKLEQELENLRTVKRKEVADKIKVARGYGDLSENAEYDAAKEEQASVEARIADLEATLKLARIMDESELSNDTASIGMHVKILAEGDDLEDAEEYDLTGSTEADMDLNRISDESPVGAALIGCKVGDHFDVTLPNGNIITYNNLTDVFTVDSQTPQAGNKPGSSSGGRVRAVLAPKAPPSTSPAGTPAAGARLQSTPQLTAPQEP